MGITDLSISTDGIIGVVFSILILCFLIVNSIYWYQIVSEFNNKTLVETVLTVSKGTAQTLMIISIIGAIILGLYMLYNAARWFYNTNLDAQKNYLLQRWKTNKKVYNDKQSSNKADYSPPGSPNSPYTSLGSPSSPVNSPAYVNQLIKAGPQIEDPEPLETFMGIPFQQPNPNVTRIGDGPISLNKKYTPKYDPKHGAVVCGEKEPNEPKQSISKIAKDGNDYILTGTVPFKNNWNKRIRFDIKTDEAPESFDSKQPTGTKDNQPIVIDA